MNEEATGIQWIGTAAYQAIDLQCFDPAKSGRRRDIRRNAEITYGDALIVQLRHQEIEKNIPSWIGKQPVREKSGASSARYKHLTQHLCVDNGNWNSTFISNNSVQSENPLRDVRHLRCKVLAIYLTVA